MSYKNAVAGLPMGGGKAVILADGAGASRERLFPAHGRFVETLGGRYITAEDVGTSLRRHGDRAAARRRTWPGSRIHRRSRRAACSGRSRPRPVTAGACDDLARPLGRAAGLRSRGHGARATCCARLAPELIVCDVDEDRARRCAADAGAEVVAPDRIYDAAVDVFAPCALGGILNATTIPRLQCALVVGAANNQLASPEDADRLARRGHPLCARLRRERRRRHRRRPRRLRLERRTRARGGGSDLTDDE